MENLERALGYYYESPIGMAAGFNFGPKLARNIGWLYYQISDACERSGCAAAIEWHEKALGRKKDEHFSGNPRYALALVNLGEIYRAQHDKTKSYESLNDALGIHQDMVRRGTAEARNEDYRCLYVDLAQFYQQDGRQTDALMVKQQGTQVFGPQLWSK